MGTSDHQEHAVDRGESSSVASRVGIGESDLAVVGDSDLQLRVILCKLARGESASTCERLKHSTEGDGIPDLSNSASIACLFFSTNTHTMPPIPITQTIATIIPVIVEDTFDVFETRASETPTILFCVGFFSTDRSSAGTTLPGDKFVCPVVDELFSVFVGRTSIEGGGTGVVEF